MSFRKYRRKQIAELRPWVEGDDMARVSVSAADKEAGSPKHGDMIARNPKNHDDQWLVAAAYFADNFEDINNGERVDRGVVINRRARTGSQLVTQRETVQKLEKQVASMRVDASRFEEAKARLRQLEKEYVFWKNVETNLTKDGAENVVEIIDDHVLRQLRAITLRRVTSW